MSTRIEGNVALVTGSNRGIGRAIAETLIERGAAKVYATARNADDLKDLAEKYGDRLQPIALDITDDKQLQKVAADTGDVQLLFNNAGVAIGGEVSATSTIDVARKELEVNYIGLLATSQAFTPALKGNGGGAIVNVVSVGGLTNFPFYPTYSASKAAAHSLTQAQRMLLAAEGIKVHGVYPGPVDTDMAKGIEMEKASPTDVATAILDAVEAGEEDIFPDTWARDFATQWSAAPKESERQIAAMLEQG